LKRGDRLVSVNGSEVHDSLDFLFHASEERLSLVITSQNGVSRKLRIVKDPDDMLGVEFPPLSIRRCRNKCIFCFVDQMPPGCRKSLYVKDDDYRASFLYGNYITLGNLREDDWERIFTQRLSPLYISVHATEPLLRAFLMRNKNAPDIMTNMKRLAAGGIRMHTQIVLSPGINDGRHLLRTIDDIAGLFPAVLSIAVVPVGITGHREGLFPLRPFKPSEALRVVQTIQTIASRFKKQIGTRLVYPSDEFYIKARLPFPALSTYEDLPQIENGVGMVASFLHEAKHTPLPRRVRPITMTAVTGVSFSPILRAVLKRLQGTEGVSVRVITARNTLFGPPVTVSGLLSGRDILTAVQGKRIGSMLLIPSSTLNENEGILLDNMKIDDIEAVLGVPVRAVSTFGDVVDLITIQGAAIKRKNK
jgi:putative radical SAM enzyme (TIGR03279 family)